MRASGVLTPDRISLAGSAVCCPASLGLASGARGGGDGLHATGKALDVREIVRLIRTGRPVVEVESESQG